MATHLVPLLLYIVLQVLSISINLNQEGREGTLDGIILAHNVVTYLSHWLKIKLGLVGS